MKKIIVSTHNRLLAESITKMLAESGEFIPFRVVVEKNSDATTHCKTLQPDLLLAEVSYYSGTSLEKRLAEAKEIRKSMPSCKLVLLCDENSAPDIAKEVMCAKKDGKIDAFFYTSVTQNYLLAALQSM